MRIREDLQYLGYVLLACLVYMIWHMSSLYFSVLSMVNIMLSVPVSLVINRFLFNVRYFSNLHLSVIIILVGVGSDDVFVFHDCWKSNFRIKALTHRSILRLTYTYKKAFKSMMVTSLTTAGMFGASISMAVLPI